jgi:hypothetical protein
VALPPSETVLKIGVWLSEMVLNTSEFGLAVGKGELTTRVASIEAEADEVGELTATVQG